MAPLLPLDLPEKLRGVARDRVAERQLVEHLSTPVSGFEMRPFLPKGVKLWTRVLVVEAGLAEVWRKGLRPGCIALVPDYLLLPTAPGLWTVDVQDETIIARLGVEDGFAAEPDLALALLAQAAPPKAILRMGRAHSDLDALLAGLSVPVLTDPAALKKAGFAPMRWSDALGGLDLKDPPSATYDRLRAKVKRWRVAVICAALAGVIWAGTLALETHRLRAERTQDTEIMLALVREHFVPSGPVLDVRAQVSAAVQSAAVPEAPEVKALPPITQFQIAAPVLTDDTLRLLTAAYRADTGLVTTVEAVDFAALDQVTEDLREAGFVVDQLDSRAQQAGGVVARLRLELAQ
jgi:general secretion pathway protein L